MKILIVVTRSELGGAQVFALNLARGLKAAGNDVTVAGGPGEYLPAELSAAGVPFHRLRNLERSHNPAKILKFSAELKEYVKGGAFDIVHLNSTNALAGVWSLAKLKPRPKIIFTVHGLSFLDPNHRGNFLSAAAYRLFFKLAWKKVDRLVFVSRLNRESARARGLAGGGEVVYNGLDSGSDYFLDRSAARDFLGEKAGSNLQDAFVYGSIGRLAYPKNYEFLINSHREMKKIRPQAKLILIGEGPERAKYEALIRSYRLEKDVYLLGEIPDAGRYLRAFDLFVLPSVYEGMSLSLIEAAGAGVPAIASRVGGNEEIIGKENCFVLDDQADFLAKAAAAGPAADSGRFELGKMIEGYEEIYRG